MTRGYALPAAWVIHTVGPIWRGGGHGEERLLAACYRNCLALAERHELRTVAFPSISTGAYRFPLARAATIAVQQVKESLSMSGELWEVVFVCFDEGTENAYAQALKSAEA